MKNTLTEIEKNTQKHLKIEPLEKFYSNLSSPSMKGFKRVFNTRQSMNMHIDVLWEKKSERLDVIAFGLKSFRDSQQVDLLKKLKNGLKLRILTIEPSSIYLKQREKDEALVESSIAKTIQDLKKWTINTNITLSNENDVLLKFYNSLPLDFYWRQDESIFIGPYLNGIGSQQTVTYEIDIASSIGKFYLNYFEGLWDNKEFSYEYK